MKILKRFIIINAMVNGARVMLAIILIAAAGCTSSDTHTQVKGDAEGAKVSQTTTQSLEPAYAPTNLKVEVMWINGFQLYEVGSGHEVGLPDAVEDLRINGREIECETYTKQTHIGPLPFNIWNTEDGFIALHTKRFGKIRLKFKPIKDGQTDPVASFFPSYTLWLIPSQEVEIRNWLKINL